MKVFAVYGKGTANGDSRYQFLQSGGLIKSKELDFA